MSILGIPLKKKVAPHSSILAWEIPWTEETGRLQSMKLQRVRHDCATEDACARYSMVMATIVMNIVNYVILGKLLNLFEILLCKLGIILILLQSNLSTF